MMTVDYRGKFFHKETDTNLYLHWKPLAPDIWQIGKLKGLFRRAIMICSEGESFENEIKHLKLFFNQYPTDVVEKTFKKFVRKLKILHKLELLLIKGKQILL